MANVTNIQVKKQTGTDNTYYATWDFNETTVVTNTGPGAFRTGDLVSIKPGATYYNGSHIPDWVMGQRWYLMQVKGDRAVLGRNESNTNNIESPINVNNLNGGSGGTTSSIVTNTLDHYEINWYYDSGDGVWFHGGSSNVSQKNFTFSPPSNSIRLTVDVCPVSKTYSVNGNSTSYWTGTHMSVEHDVTADPPPVPSTPTAKIEKYTLTASIENVDNPRTDEISFEVYNDTTLVNTGLVTVLACRASYSCTVTAGGKYRVRARAVNINSTSRVYSDYTDFTSELTTIPIPVTDVKCAADSETSVKVEWTGSATATSYKIEYTKNKSYFDSSSEVSSITVENTIGYVTGLDTGTEWFFRVSAVNDKGESAPSNIVSTVIGSKPSSPTTWSSTTTVMTGELLNLYWVHNSEDGSSQTYAEVEINVDGDIWTETIRNDTEDEDEKDKTKCYTIDTSEYLEGTVIQWRVRTAGVTKQYGDWSILRTVDVYAPPTLELTLTNNEGMQTNVITSFPFHISGLAGPKTQAAIGYHLIITSNYTYYTIDQIGNRQMVNAGDEVYSKYFDITTALDVDLTPSDVDLENGILYTITCTASMDSGLTAESSIEMNVQWTDTQYQPECEISLNADSYSTFIRPYCLDAEGNTITNVTLSVYRRNYDGTFVEIVTGLDGGNNVFITDPHPALDFARYRIIAIDKSTGSVSYYDAPGYPVGGTSVIIQWDEEWKDIDVISSAVQEQPMWSGSMLKLPYNIEVSDSNNIDVSLVEYIGRSHPVSYYGTQKGTKSSWKMEVDKNDIDVLYALRRLSNYAGDVYVREPSGSGYWANISVSFSQKYSDLVIPITLDITRVEGEM